MSAAPRARRRVLALVVHPVEGASARHRVFQLVGPLAEHGVDVHPSPLLSPEVYRSLYRPGGAGRKAAALVSGALRRAREALAARRWDAVWVLREAYPLGPALAEAAVARRGTRLIYDLDDAVFLPNASPAHRRLAPFRSFGKVADVVRRADLVLAGSPALVEWCRPLARRVELAPTVVDTERVTPAARPPAGAASAAGAVPAGDPFVVGWTGSHTTAPYLADWLASLAASRAPAAIDRPPAAASRAGDPLAGLVLSVAGAGDHPLPGADALGWRVDRRPWRLDEEPAWLASLSAGVAPLPDVEWTRYKCGLRVLLTLAAGAPVVASPVGVQADFAREAPEAVLAATTPEDWREAIARLAADPAGRRAAGLAGRRWVEARYSVRSLVPRLAALFREES